MGGHLVRALRRYFRRPRIVLELALLAGLLSSAIIILLAVGSAQVLIGEGSEALPTVYLLLAGVSVPLASGISTALCRWPVARISRSVSLASLFLVLALRLALAAELPGAALAICVTAYALEIIFDTLFWLSAAEQLPTLELKRHTPFLAAAFGLGGIFAGFVATIFCEIFAGEDLLVLNAGFFALCVLQYRRIDRRYTGPDAQVDDEPEPGIVEALKSTVGILRAFPIIGAISLGVVLMAALFCLQDYLAMTTYEASFPDANELSSFMAIVFAGHQAAELIILAACGRLILERAGPVLRNLIFPITTCAGLVTFLGFRDLTAAVFVHANVIALSNAVFEPVKTLNFAALPYRVLAQVRMLVDGILYPLGIALSAIGLLWLQSGSGIRLILLVSIATGIAFVGVSAMIGAMFLPNLLRSLRLRAITPAEYARADKGRAFSAGDIRQLLAHPDAEARRFGADLARSLAPELLTAPGADAEHGNRPDDHVPAWPSPRRSAAEEPEAAGASALRLRQRDFVAVGETPPPSSCTEPSGWARSRRSDAGIWRLALISRKPSSQRLEEIGAGLEDRASAVRRTAAGLLARFGAAAVPVAAQRLASPRPEVVEAAIHALGGTGTRKAENLLRDHVRPLYRRVRLNLAALEVLGRWPEVAAGLDARRALEAWLLDGNRRIMRRVFVVKSALGNPRDIKLLRALTMAREARTRSDAVEALVNLPTKRFIQPLVPLLEARPDACLEAADAPASADETLRQATHDDPFARLLLARLIAATGEGDRAADALGDEPMLNLVLFLKTTPLFGAIPLEDIARIAGLAEPVFLAAGERVTEAEEAVRHVFLVRSGTVQIRIGERAIETIGTGASIGESVLFGEERHAVSVYAASAVSLLRFPVSIIGDLVAEYPEALAPLALDLGRRINRLRAQLAALPGSGDAGPGGECEPVGGTSEAARAAADAGHR